MEQYIDLFWTVVSGISMIVAGATVIAKITKTKKDDEILGKIHSWVEAVAELKKPEKAK